MFFEIPTSTILRAIELYWGWQAYGMREYLGGETPIFASVDPLTTKYPMLTPYQFASDIPISGIDLDGLEYSPAGRIGPDQLAINSTSVQLRRDLDNTKFITAEKNIQNKLNKLISKRDFVNAVYTVINSYQLLQKVGGITNDNFKVELTDIGYGGLMVTKGNENEVQTITININDISTDSKKFGFFVRGIFHELTHVRQKTQKNPILDHTEKEFLAYSEQFSNKGLPEETQEIRTFEINSALSYYNQLPASKQKEYADKKKQLDIIKERILDIKEKSPSNIESLQTKDNLKKTTN